MVMVLSPKWSLIHRRFYNLCALRNTTHSMRMLPMANVVTNFHSVLVNQLSVLVCHLFLPSINNNNNTSRVHCPIIMYLKSPLFMMWCTMHLNQIVVKCYKAELISILKSCFPQNSVYNWCLSAFPTEP